MIARAMIGNPWVFNKNIDVDKIPLSEKIKMFIYHIKLYQKTYGKLHDISPLKKFYKIYVAGFPNASSIRQELMNLKNGDEVRSHVFIE